MHYAVSQGLLMAIFNLNLMTTRNKLKHMLDYGLSTECHL